LCYVGMTRAQERLVLAHATSRSLWGSRTFNLPSRFLEELPEEGVLVERLRPASWSGYGAREIRPRQELPALAAGDSVRHGTLGEGVVLRVEPGGVVTVRFAGDGAERRLMLEYAPLEVRRVRSEEELREAAAAIVHYFGREKPDEEWSDRWLKNFKLERMLAAVDEGGATVGGAGAFSFRMTVPGGTTLPTAGVTLVGVLPTHRRRGILGSMMRAQLDDVHERGEPLAALWASEETIYARYGYGLASLILQFEIQRVHGAFRAGTEHVGSVRFVEPGEAAKLLPPVYDAVQRATPGMLERPASWWEHRLLADPPAFRFGGSPKHFAVLEVDGEPQAYAIYRLHVAFGTL